MSRMGKWLLIFGIIALVSAIAFGVSVAALGVADNNYSINLNGTNINFLGGLSMGKASIYISDGENVITKDFEENKIYSAEMDGTQINDISIGLASCHANVVCTDTDTLTVKYTTGTRPLNFTAEIKNGKLIISEKLSSWFSFGAGKASELELGLPKKLYDHTDISLASGELKSADLTSDDLSLNVASGNTDLGIYAGKMTISVASGSVRLTNCSGGACKDLNLSVASGNLTMNGFGSGDTKISIASGKIILDGISGSVDSSIMSGHLALIYSEWNGDLDIDIASGKTDVTLPAGSGIDLDFERASGSCSIELDSDSTKLNKNTSAVFGGSNVHKVSVSEASGSTVFHN